MIKRFIKLILFAPFLVLSVICAPVAAIIWVITGKLPNSLLQYLIEW